MSGQAPPNLVCGWLGSDAIQQACASKFPAMAAAAPWLPAQARPISPTLLYKA